MKFWPSRSLNKYQAKFSYGLIFIPAFCFIYFQNINWLLVYLIYSVFYIFGVEIGYHRSLCHGVRYQASFEVFCLWLGSLTHIGTFRESILFHLHHHDHSDTEFDHKKNLLTAISPEPGRIKWKSSRFTDPLRRVRENRFLTWVDRNYYFWLALNYTALCLVFGFENTVLYIALPASLVLLVHRYAAVIYHSSNGYRNYDMGNNSRNVVWLLPIVFGENWHNNHHHSPRASSNKLKWWEFDPSSALGHVFRVQSNE